MHRDGIFLLGTRQVGEFQLELCTGVLLERGRKEVQQVTVNVVGRNGEHGLLFARADPDVVAHDLVTLEQRLIQVVQRGTLLATVEDSLNGSWPIIIHVERELARGNLRVEVDV